MGVTLAKGGNVSLSKARPNLTNVLVGLGWDATLHHGADFDLDASALAVQRRAGHGRRVVHLLQPAQEPDGSVEHTGDNLHR